MQSPASVQRLRRFILDLAVRGKLIPQAPNDEPASELLKQIAKEKAQLVKAGEIKRPKKLPPIDEIPYSLPPSWHWTRIREITSDRGQRVPEAALTYIDVTSIDKKNGIVAGTKVLQANEAPSRARKVVQKGDVLYSCVRPYLLNVAIVDHDFDPKPIASTAFAILNGHGLVLPRYLWIVLRSPFMVARVEEDMRGQAYPAINDTDFSILPFPLPPLAEQHRIVAKVDELMRLCDGLEAAQTERETTRTRLTAASLARLNTPDPDAAKFRKHVKFALNNFTPLTTRPEQIKALRQTILNLAVRGKLVPQNPNDEPASELLQRIAKERKKHNVNGVPKRPLPLVSENEQAFTIPKNWEWARLGNVSTSLLGKTLNKAKNRGTYKPYLRSVNVYWLELKLSDIKQMKFEEQELEKYTLQKNDVLVCEGGEAGRAAVWNNEMKGIYYQNALHRIRFFGKIDPNYFVFALYSDFNNGRLADYCTGVTIKHLTSKRLAKYCFPIPPLPEQRRIVAKVDELMALCDRLEGVQNVGDERRRRLFGALLNNAWKGQGLASKLGD